MSWNIKYTVGLFSNFRSRVWIVNEDRRFIQYLVWLLLGIQYIETLTFIFWWGQNIELLLICITHLGSWKFFPPQLTSNSIGEYSITSNTRTIVPAYGLTITKPQLISWIANQLLHELVVSSPASRLLLHCAPWIFVITITHTFLHE